jgi:single-strand DNA-binding protein
MKINAYVHCRIGTDIEQRQAQGGTVLASFRFVTTEKIKGEEHTTWMDAVAFGKTAEMLVQYFGKGKTLILMGVIREDKWQDRETGQSRSKHKLYVNGFDFVTGNRQENEGQQPNQVWSDEPQPGNPRRSEDFDVPF